MSAPAGVARMPAGFRQPPHNLHAERLVLGTLLANSRRFGVVSHMLRAEHFYVPDHQACFERIERASAKGEYFDWTTIAGGMDPEPLARLADGAASIQSDELCAYARVVVDLAHRRALIRISEEMQNRAYDTTLPETAAEQLAVARGYLQALANESAAGQKEQIKLIMADQCTLETDVFWAIEGVLPRCSMMMLYARGGAGKTYLSTSLASGLATGQWFSHKAEHGAVLVCAFERPQDAEDRLAATRDRLGIQGAPVALLRFGGMALNHALAEIIIQRAKELREATKQPVRAIQMDTVSAALAGAKEDDEGLGRLRSIGERIHAETGALVIWIHHEGKGDAMGPRGHLALAEGCAVWWHVEQRENGDRVVHVGKANRGPSYMPLFAFRLVPFEAGTDCRGNPIQLCEIQLTQLDCALASPAVKRFGPPEQDKEPKLGARQKLLMRLLRRLADKHPEGVPVDVLKSAFFFEMNAERERNGKAQRNPDQGRVAFHQVLKGLRDRSIVAEGVKGGSCLRTEGAAASSAFVVRPFKEDERTNGPKRAIPDCPFAF